jgi:hypothetical protein
VIPSRFAAVGAAALVAAWPAGLPAQIRASERSTVSQVVDGTTITMDYARPKVRGRDSLFGGVVRWGAVWTGANWATTFKTDRDLKLDGHAVPAGKYSVWFRVEPGTWTLILDPEPERFHIRPPDSAAGQVRLPVRPETGPHVEALTWSFPDFRPTGTTLRFAWGTTAVSLAIEVEPSQTFTVDAGFAERFVGTYQLERRGMLRDMMGEGTVRFEVGYRDGYLTATWEKPPNPRLGDIRLAPRGAGMFLPIELEQGELFDVLTDLVLEFTPLEGRATGFELRGLRDELWGVGTRVGG